MIRVQRVQHVSIPRPPGAAADQQAVQFYEGLLGLEHIPEPRTFANIIEVTWFRKGDVEIHVFAAEPNEGQVHPGSHFCLVVDDVQSARQQLEAAGYRCEDTTPIPNRPRFNTQDPFGNRIEITEINGDYLAESAVVP